MSQERIPRKFQGVWIPASLWLDHSLSTNEKVML
ncbi:MAG: helix-turn-helix domain-containing protein, partial [Chitinophagaceae bacterium]